MNILTFDIEDWWVYDHFSIGKPGDYLPRLDRYLSEILDLLDERGFKATFFCLGHVASKYPQVIKKIANRGHHIGSHSYGHRFLGDLNPDEFALDTKLGIEVLEDIIGSKVDSYRAPAFSITPNSKWAIEILTENGIKYDCSIYPSTRSFGGFPSFGENKPCIIKYNNKEIREFPMSLTKVLGKDIAYSGGGYFRLLPYSMVKQIVNKADYTICYFHLKDFDYQQDKKGSLLTSKELFLVRYFKNYYGIKGAYTKFKIFMHDFEFISIKQAASLIDWKSAPIINL